MQHRASPSPSPPLVLWLWALLLLGATSARALPPQNADDDAADADAAEIEALADSRYVEPFLVAVVAWNVLVVTLEVNDFRRRLTQARAGARRASGGDARDGDVAALMAVRYGLRDALVDWALLYTAGYAVVAGITYTDADPDMLVVLLGFSLMFSATLLAIGGIKLPQWLGIYDRSALQILRDTSDIAPRAVRELWATDTDGDGDGVTSVVAFRYQVRLGVGTHFFQFTVVLLPMYAGLRWWAYLLSLAAGVACGHAVLFAVHACRRRCARRREAGALGASVLVLLASAGVLARGLRVVERGWKPSFGRDEAPFLALSSCAWLACCGVGLCARYGGRRRRAAGGGDDDAARLFEDAAEEREGGDVRTEEDGPETPSTDNRPAQQEPLLEDRAERRNVSTRASWSHYLDDSAAFDRVQFPRENVESLRSTIGGAPREIYQAFAAKSDTDTAWYHRLWNFLPARPLWDLSAMGARNTFSCCSVDSYFKKKLSCYQKGLFVLRKFLLVCFNLLAIFVTIVVCGATIQRKVTLEKWGYSYETNYGPKMNEGPVCAFNEKCGGIQTFPSKEDADSANYTIAHCGPCGDCSNWNDFALQPTDLATPAQGCGQKNFFTVDALSDITTCIETDIGFTKECAPDWAANVLCSRKHCGFIFIQSVITDKVGHFEVRPSTITSATCSEANCEAGNPGNFVAHVGANRRRMNVKSEIARPASLQCAIVGIPKDSKNYSNWVEFMEPGC